MRKLTLVVLSVISVGFCCGFDWFYTPNITMVEALNSGDVKAVNYYLNHDVNANQKDDKGNPFLILAVKQGSVPVVERLIKGGAMVNASNAQGAPLLYASSLNRADLVRVLAQAGADVNAVEKDGFTPLLFAISGGQTEIARLLINARAKVNMGAGVGLAHQAVAFSKLEENSKKKETALTLAEENGHDEIVVLLRRTGAKRL